MADRLSIYNDALLFCGQRALATLTDNVESRYLLDQIWNGNGVIDCLEQGQWFFAMRAVMFDYDPSITPPFGYPYAFGKPSDWVLTSAISSDEFFRSPLTRSVDETGYWYSDCNPIYVRYVSSDASYGLNVGNWPLSFEQYVAAYFASKVVLKLSNDKDLTKIVLDIAKQKLLQAKSRAAMAQPTSFPPPGSWTLARIRGVNRRDGGYTSGNLY